MTGQPASPQSLAHGAVGHALLDIERALAGTGDWTTAKNTIQDAARSIQAGPSDCLYYGTPATAFMLACASGDGRPRYEAAAKALDRHVQAAAARKLNAARSGSRLQFADYDLFRGLTGFAALLLRTAPGSDILGQALSWLTELTRPRHRHGHEVPGWWVDDDPDPILPTPGGHANLGMAHGAAGILAVLALATRAGHTVPGQEDAIARLIGVFEQWRQEGDDGPSWPQWLTSQDLRAGALISHDRPPRASWCYGAVGISRALQLAALATDDTTRQDAAEVALLAGLTDHHLDQLHEPGLCHGLAGVYQTASRAAHDARTPLLAARLPALSARVAALTDQPEAAGLLTGATGIALAAETAHHSTPPHSGWDRCLLIA